MVGAAAAEGPGERQPGAGRAAGGSETEQRGLCQAGGAPLCRHRPGRAPGCLPPGPDLTVTSFHPQMQVLLAQVQNSEQLLRTLQGTVSQAQERVQLQMVRAGGRGTRDRSVTGTG